MGALYLLLPRHGQRVRGAPATIAQRLLHCTGRSSTSSLRAGTRPWTTPIGSARAARGCLYLIACFSARPVSVARARAASRRTSVVALCAHVLSIDYCPLGTI